MTAMEEDVSTTATPADTLLYRLYLFKVPENNFNILLAEDLVFAETIQPLGILRGDYLLKITGSLHPKTTIFHL